MKKLLYVSFEDLENQASGVNKKIFGHLEAFEKRKFSTELVAIYKSDIALFHGREKKLIKSIVIPRISLCNWVVKNASNYDVIYIRFQFFCPFVLYMLLACKKADVVTLMEIPTYPYINELKEQGLKGIPKRIIDASFGKLCSKYIDSFVSPLYSKSILGRTCIEIYNGINTDHVVSRNRINNEQIDLLAVAMMGPWHGYDRLIYGIYNYYQNGGIRNIRLHLVGEGVATYKYERLIRELQLENHVTQYGKKFGADLDKLYDLADIGVGALASFRKKVYRANTLKVLEYMAKGLPVICEEGEVGIPDDSIYRLTIPADNSPIDINQVLDFYDSIYKLDLETIVYDIRDYCAKNCSHDNGLKKVFEFLEKYEGDL